MFRYALKNLKNLFLRQKLLAFLLVVNIVMACLVICFSYGLYSDFFTRLHEGEEEEYTDLTVYAREGSSRPLEDRKNSEWEGPFSMGVMDIKASTLFDFAFALSEDTRNNLKCIRIEYFFESPLTAPSIKYDADDYYYTGEDEPYYLPVRFVFTVRDGKIVDAWGDVSGADVSITEEQYSNGDKVVVVEKIMYEQTWGGVYFGRLPTEAHEEVPYMSVDTRVLTDDIEYININGEPFKIVGKSDKVPMTLYFPLTAFPDASTVFVGGLFNDGPGSPFSLNFKEPVTRQQYEDVKKCLLQTIGDDVYLPPIKLQEATELKFYRTVMLISVVIALLAAINMVILYRYILEKRSGELAIFRICGCSKIKAVMAYLLECFIINIPLFIATQIVFDSVIKQKLTDLFPEMEMAYSFKLYFAMFAIYIGVSVAVMLIMIAVMVKKHSLVALKSAPKATSRFDVMKVFEVLQLTAVIAIIVLIVSAVVSRYEMYTPFQKYIERRGYMVTALYATETPEEFEKRIGNAEAIINEASNIYVGQGSYNGNLYDISLWGIMYSDEFIDAYKPPMQEGLWLNETDETYENSGYVPIVLTSCDGRYKVGDIFEDETVMSYDDDGNPVDTMMLKYKIIGILQDNVSIASYVVDNLNPYSYTDIYSVFSDDFETQDWFIARVSDSSAMFGGLHGPLQGIQFVFCDDMSDEEFEQVGKNINQADGLSAISLSIVRKNSLNHIYEQMYTLFPIAVCIFILTIISTVSISAIYTKRQLRNYAIFYICGARWRTCALRSLKNSAITCAISVALAALILVIGKLTLLSETVISFGMWHLAVCAGVIVLYLALSMIMPLSIIGSSEPREVLKEE